MSLKVNRLAAETSPYLRQHMHNPVQWYAWGNEAWERAQKENKLVLISIGYSACHWCHVMEHECFENESLAAFMNEHFINIKVDREERPDIDNIYMDAVQLMTGRGGWPLNCFALPDKRPVYGGTYFPPEHWHQVLHNLADVYVNQPGKVLEYANKMVEGLKQSERNIIPPVGNVQPLHPEKALPGWKTIFDNEFGGPRKAPKFPLPVNYIFLLRYAHIYNDAEVLAHVEFTLQQMAHGGIYDHVGGGFARYSVDAQWHVPHFEKMLYDNAQLISLYSEAFIRFKKPLFKQVVRETIHFVNRELRSEEGLFYSALDADTNGEEGDFYVWTSEELKSVLTEKEFEMLDVCYGIDTFSDWEHGKNVLRLLPGTEEENKKNVQPILKKLFEVREKRTRPGLDTKILTSWNGLMLTGLCKAGIYLEDAVYIEMAEKSYAALKKHNTDDKGNWIHCRQGNEKFISCFADDLALIAEAQLALYEATFNEKYIEDCRNVHAFAMNNFYDEQQGLFTFSARTATDVIVHKTEIFDNVIPASNSVWAQVLLKLGSYLGKPEIFNLGEAMTRRMAEVSVKTPTVCGQWLVNELIILHQREVAVCGAEAMDRIREMRKEYLPQALFAADENGQSGLALLESRLISGQTLIYVCHKNTCNLAVATAVQALQNLRQVSE